MNGRIYVSTNQEPYIVPDDFYLQPGDFTEVFNENNDTSIALGSGHAILKVQQGDYTDQEFDDKYWLAVFYYNGTSSVQNLKVGVANVRSWYVEWAQGATGCIKLGTQDGMCLCSLQPQYIDNATDVTEFGSYRGRFCIPFKLKLRNAVYTRVYEDPIEDPGEEP